MGDDRDVTTGFGVTTARRAAAGGDLGVPDPAGPLPRLGAGAAHVRRRRGAAVGQRGGRRAGVRRPVGRGVVLPRRAWSGGFGEVLAGRLAAHRRRRRDHAGRLPAAHRPVEGHHQVRRRVDLVGGSGERGDGAPGGRGGRGGRRAGREVVGAAAGGGRVAGGPVRHARGAA